MSLSDRVVGLDELAAALGRKPEYIIRNWLKMHRKLGMPRKNPGGWIWPRGAMEAWLDGAEVQQLQQFSDLVANQNAKLSHRYGIGRQA